MAAIGKKTQDQLDRIKGNCKTYYDYFKPNFDRFHEFRRFVFSSNLSDDDITLLQMLQKPQLEFNILEAYISRLRGEFARQMPSISVRSEDGAPVDAQVLKIVENHFRAIFFEANCNSFEYDIYTDLLSGGFSVMKYWTEYASSMGNTAFDQVIKVGRVDDPTMCGFDMLARYPHKGDGQYSFELYPKTVDQFEQEFGDIGLDDMSFTRNFEGFTWSYTNNQDDIVLVGDYYEKKKKKAKIVQLATGQIMKESDYELFLANWGSLGTLSVPPAASRSRWSDIETICRYQVIENQIIDYSETDYSGLPHIFVDGNSINLRQSESGSIQQMTRPYVYHAKDTQRFINYAGQCWANELENMVQHKWIVPLEAIPEQYKDAYTNNQVPGVVIYKSFNDQQPEQAVPPPQVVARPPMPPEIQGAFSSGLQYTQNILGAYDASLGVQGNDISGKAIIAGSTNSNASAMPYVVGFMQGLNQLAQCVIDLMPKKYTLPRNIPVQSAEGKGDSVKINSPGAPQMNYEPGQLKVRVQASVNFSVQKEKAIQTIIQMCHADQVFAEFVNTMGLDVLLDNLEFRGIDDLKEKAKVFMQQKQQMQQKAAQQPNPQAIMAQINQQKLQLEQMKMQMDQQQAQVDAQLKAGEIANDAQANDNDRLKLILQSNQSELDNAVRLDAHQTEKYKTAIDAALQVADQQHSHSKDAVELGHSAIDLAHKITTENKKVIAGRSEKK